MSSNIGESIHALATKLWSYNRSITGNGVRETLGALKELLPDLKIIEVPSGTKVFDWTIPNEWNVREAWIEDEAGNRIVDFSEHNLHLVGYSIPVDVVLDLEELQEHLYSISEQPDAIPYVTSYYSPYWGFCLRHQDRIGLKSGNYHVYIDATLESGSLSYGELVIQGESSEEVLLSTYICHPSMANNELSGPCVTTFLANWLQKYPDRRFTYRILFIPETIGSITYLSKNLSHLKEHVIAGYNITCIGDDRCYSYLPSRNGNTLSDHVAVHVLKNHAQEFKQYRYLDRGSDERQYCSPGVDLPMATIMRSKYEEYPEYHTSKDNLSLITPRGLQGGYEVLCRAMEIIESNCIPRATVLCEPQLGKYGLYPKLSEKSSGREASTIMNFLAYCDGTSTLLDIAEIIEVPYWELYSTFTELKQHGLVESVKATY